MKQTFEDQQKPNGPWRPHEASSALAERSEVKTLRPGCPVLAKEDGASGGAKNQQSVLIVWWMFRICVTCVFFFLLSVLCEMAAAAFTFNNFWLFGLSCWGGVLLKWMCSCLCFCNVHIVTLVWFGFWVHQRNCNLNWCSLLSSRAGWASWMSFLWSYPRLRQWLVFFQEGWYFAGWCSGMICSELFLF